MNLDHPEARTQGDPREISRRCSSILQVGRSPRLSCSPCEIRFSRNLSRPRRFNVLIFAGAQSVPYRFEETWKIHRREEHTRKKKRPRVSRTSKPPRCKCARNPIPCPLTIWRDLSNAGFRPASNPAGHRFVSTAHFL